ncbi:16S rRNA (adenine(1518)-N(6)/adenine(1519)-N(6))-dimethyltransferase RsmA [Methylomicrobium sp. Wu6]|uniref:16S rRNA (adenine(1518)-N(6)/adenine(1519)-N(6))- dimethyltransferase RsmA n=1 Tax=Methylomicrobium sp. Wu6 TaxID=3107928 RepID=UPI002DD68A35|nr:16S rRNA (adenine(1518)-N(6)/adenine(1519)-N(6))-dimethyltransferase RsmA [Methylomicrobium sp. Wu6]MEC4749362.1 16S rRNA (adenine(1518)-N(6)/adenine(1519)-N(6))-dimethyltransferase RsmA [Methylomicrobium sp. Wu6]
MTHIARKRFGQNFLHDQSVIRHIIACLDAKPDQHWVEIGPGQGALTEPLLKTGARLDVVELDRDLVELLKKKFAGQTHFEIHSADALKFDFSTLAKEDERLRIVGNLPYNISTPLMFHLLSNAHCIEDMHFMLQKEVVDRLCAEPGNKQYGRLSVMMQYACEAECLFDVPPESFDPAPKVISSIVRLTPHRRPPVQVDSRENLNRVVTQAFSQRRKTLRNSLKDLISDNDLNALSIDPKLRAENLTLSDFAKLSNLLDNVPQISAS